MKLQKVISQKSLKLLAENLYVRPPIQSIQYTCSYSLNFKGGLCNRRAIPAIVRAELCAREAISFCDFRKWPPAISPSFTPSCLNQTFNFWDVLGKEYYS